MYKGYKILPANMDFGGVKETDNFRQAILNQQVQDELLSYLSPDGTVDGGALENKWFPQIEVDVFISHSHADKNIANALAAWLYRSFGLTAFVDEGVWGQSDALLKAIDNKYCMFPDGGMYDYEKRNKSTAYVHMLLSMALAKLIDKTECLFFLNTPNSIRPQSAIQLPETHSPWLYYELGLSSLLQKPLKKHRRFDEVRRTRAFADKSINEAMNYIILPANTKHLTTLTQSDLSEWYTSHFQQLDERQHPLDILYTEHP